jgi:hypothetical protein
MRFATTAVKIESNRILRVSVQRVGSDDVRRTAQSTGLHSCVVSGSFRVKTSRLELSYPDSGGFPRALQDYN